MKHGFILAMAAAATLSACASTYGNLVSGSNLGAMEYKPAVLVNAGQEGKYEQVLSVCRQVAVNRQVTAAQEAQLKSITGVSNGALQGAAAGMQIGNIFKQAGLGGSMTKDIGVGMMSGVLSSLGTAFANGTEHDADETKRILLSCLRTADAGGQIYKVLE